MAHWSFNAVIYHLFPLGALGAEHQNPGTGPQVPRLRELLDWIPYLESLGVNTLLLGPVLESTSHGYDTRDYGLVDRRLGTNEDLRAVVRGFHDRGFKVLLDAVYNHSGRDFGPFQDLRHRGAGSDFMAWFQNVRFDQRSPYGDNFSYEGWAGHYNLVKFNLQNPSVRRFLLDSTAFWMEEFGIDGLRLDAADVLAPVFMEELRQFCLQKNPDFWLMGEVVHGDYRSWVRPEALNSVTNYEAYKGLWSSHKDKNYFEIAYSLQRQFAQGGIYQGFPLMNFADNHDVPRVASLVAPADLYPLHCLLFTMPGVPSIYYGSETGLKGQKAPDSDWPLRPRIQAQDLQHSLSTQDLPRTIQRLIALRKESQVLQLGDYAQIHVQAQQLVFTRSFQGETLLVVINGAPEAQILNLPWKGPAGWMEDLLNPGTGVCLTPGQTPVELFPSWARVFRIPRSQAPGALAS